MTVPDFVEKMNGKYPGIEKFTEKFENAHHFDKIWWQFWMEKKKLILSWNPFNYVLNFPSIKEVEAKVYFIFI